MAAGEVSGVDAYVGLVYALVVGEGYPAYIGEICRHPALSVVYILFKDNKLYFKSISCQCILATDGIIVRLTLVAIYTPKGVVVGDYISEFHAVVPAKAVEYGPYAEGTFMQPQGADFGLAVVCAAIRAVVDAHRRKYGYGYPK